MTRKDIIIISVLINAGLLAILFVTAIRTDDEPAAARSESPAALARNKGSVPVYEEVEMTPHTLITSSNDEVDLVLKDYIPYVPPTDEHTLDLYQAAQNTKNKEQDGEEVGEYVEITVKKGDVLEKIARANGVTINEIKKINHLASDKLKVGQVLKVPVAIPVVKRQEPFPAKVEKEQIASSEPTYYTVKSGDNPWKIAKQFHVRFEDILKLNNLDEEKARNLKIGDKIRVK